MARVIARGVLSFGLVSIPVDIHSANRGSGHSHAPAAQKVWLARAKPNDLSGLQSGR